jgi:hypothetical protein
MGDERGIWRLLYKVTLLGVPMLILLGVIFTSDPFKVIYSHQFGNYYNDQPYELNREYVSTELLLANYKHLPYNAFIFGSSRSFAYHCDSWQKFIGDARAFHYPAASENLYGIYSKIKFVDKLNLKFDHALVVLDYTAFGVNPRESHLHISHPRVTGGSWSDFQLAFIKASFSRFFIIKYIDYRMSGKVRPYMQDIFQIKKDSVRINPINNDYFFDAEDQQLKLDSDKFYRDRKALFPPRDSAQLSYAPPVIKEKQVEYLKEVKRIFDKHHTNYKIIISPLYDQVYLNPQDLGLLKEILGEQHVFDYSGVNDITNDMHNYYDWGHYRPHIAEFIMQEIYAKEANR